MFYLYVILSVFVGLLLIMKIYFKLNAVLYLGKERLDGKTVLVTGANSGIGFICAKDFAERGAKVLLICRDMITGEDAKNKIIMETGNENIKLKHIDFASLKKVRQCAQEILEEEEYIHILLNNAGSIVDVVKMTEDKLNITMQINYFGQFLFTNLLLGKIIKSSPSRIVNVSSQDHMFTELDLNHLKELNTKSTLTAYSMSKLALNYFSNELARLMKDTGVTVNALHPGFFSSGVSRDHSFFIRAILNFITTFFANTPKEGAQTSIYLCVSSDVENITGEYFENCRITTPSKISQDMDIAKKLWELTEDIVDLKPEEKHYYM